MGGYFNSKTPVMIIDDNEQYLKLLERLLRGVFGFQEIACYTEPAPALEAIYEDPSRLELLFIDYNLSAEITGTEILNELSEKSLLEGKAAFLITAEPSVDNLKAAKLAGAIGVVAKPFDRAELSKQLDKAERLMEMSATESF